MNWYGFIIACGIVVCVILAYFTAKKRGIEGDVVIDIIVFCLPLAIICARVYYVIFDIIDGGHWTFKKFIGLDDGGLQGLAIYGGLIGALIGAALLTLWKNRKKNPKDKRISFMQLADLGFTFIILGQAIGRWGNFTNQEAYGYKITDPNLMWFPFAVRIGSSWHYATFFYESMWNLIGFGLLFYLYAGRRKSFDGFILACYCIYYGIGRSWIEGLRSDSLWLVPPSVHGTGGTPDIGGIRVSQLLSILIILFGAAYIVQHIVRAKKAEKKIFIFVDRDKLSDEYFEYDKTKLAHPMPDINGKKSQEYEIDESGLAVPTDESRAEADSAEHKTDPQSETAGDNITVTPEENTHSKNKKTNAEDYNKLDTSEPDAEDDYEDSWDE